MTKGLKSFIIVTFSILGTWIIFQVFQMLRMEEIDKDRLNIVNKYDTVVMHTFSTFYQSINQDLLHSHLRILFFVSFL